MTDPRLSRRSWFGVRARILGWCVLLLALAVGALLVLLRQVLLDRLDDEVGAALQQEVDEVRQAVRGPQPRDRTALCRRCEGRSSTPS